jgi:hypothetical protein
MCNLYSHTKGPKAVREMAKMMRVSDRMWSLEELVEQTSR